MTRWLSWLFKGVLRLFFHLLYHQLAWSYDLVAAFVSAGKWQTWIKISLRYLEGPRVLELGHGPGHLQVLLHTQGFQPFGLDASRWMARLALNRFRAQRMPHRLVLSRAQQLPFAGFTFDHLVATFPTEFILDPPTLQEAYRVLKPGGSLVIVPFAWHSGLSILEKTLHILFRLTHQAPAVVGKEAARPFECALEDAGFRTRSELIGLPTSNVMVIVAQKPNSSS